MHEALVLSLGIPESDRIQRLYELDADCFEHNKTDKITLIELTVFPGRSNEMKSAVIKEINRLLSERLNIQPSDILIIINEPPLENWGLRGKQTSELGINYKKV